jgi:hypothetical protein
MAIYTCTRCGKQTTHPGNAERHAQACALRPKEELMKVRITMEFDDEARRALAHHHGEVGLASRQTIEGWMLGTLNASFEDITQEYVDSQED